MKTILIIQARILRPIVGRPMIELILTRLSQCKEVDQLMVAASEETENDELQAFVEGNGYTCTRGSEKDVLNRFYESAKAARADVVVRITGDCPLVDSSIVDNIINFHIYCI